MAGSSVLPGKTKQKGGNHKPSSRESRLTKTWIILCGIVQMSSGITWTASTSVNFYTPAFLYQKLCQTLSSPTQSRSLLLSYLAPVPFLLPSITTRVAVALPMEAHLKYLAGLCALQAFVLRR
mmetsp:Transcript_144775/g.252389  ORF Transcript_144775/g.252389 Transcript_144775/m.252389 type:complete len:123 (-) Transcript_144775:1653-2021(-)